MTKRMASGLAIEGLERVARLLDIVPFLTTHQGIAITELAKEFAVTEEQITKDLTTLWMCGLPGYTDYELIDLSFESGFVTISNAETLQRPRALNRDEVLALLLGLESLRQDVAETDPGLEQLISSSIERLTTLSDEALRKRVQVGDSSSSVLLAECEKAISDGSALLIKYHSVTRDEISSRTIFPLEITSDGRNTYLYAYCEDSNGYRTFRIDRIVEFFRASDTTLAKAPESKMPEDSSFSATLLVKARQRDIGERLQPKTNSAVGTENIDIHCFSPDWAVREIMSFGGAAVVSQPENLRRKIWERANSALSAYLP